MTTTHSTPTPLSAPDRRVPRAPSHAVSAQRLPEVPVVSPREIRRRRPWQPANLVVAVAVPERRRLAERLGTDGTRQLDEAIAAGLAEAFPDSRILLRDDSGRILVRVEGHRDNPERRLALARHRFQQRTFHVGEDRLRLTMMVGYVALAGIDWRDAQRHALEALAVAESRGDLVPVAWSPPLADTRTHRRDSFVARHKLMLQVLASFAIGLLVPYAGYELALRAGVAGPLTTAIYVLVSAMMIGTTVIIYIEGLLALAPRRPPADVPPAPPASAVIAAYLPNEAATIVDTVECFLAQHYSGGLQVVLAYNSPVRLPVEDVLEDLARQHPRLTLLRVEHSTSKAQNVNAALDVVTGDIVGIFDADHHPADRSFERAWRWLADGYGIVQGHCVVRNGGASWVSRTVAVEFESIYAVSHPGRAQLHGFGVFGGSNGYWRADLLRQVRMRGSMLTEDIDSSMRVTLRGVRIANDPALVSRELAPATLDALVGQRLRWAQGWSQVSLRYIREAVTSRRLTRRQKTGAVFLLGWRELYPWVSLQVWPLVAFTLAHPRLGDTHWFAPSLVLFTLVAALAGPSQALLAHVLGAPEITRHRRWFWAYALVSALFYTELKNAIARVAHLKQLAGEREWRVTPREVGV